LTRRRLTAQDAAEALGISVDAVRMRARRGTLDSEHENGRLYVWLDTDSSNVHSQGQVEALLQEKNERIEELREQVHHLREVLNDERDARRRADTIIAQLTQANAALAQRIPELEAPQEPPGGPESAAEGQERAEPRSGAGGPQTGSDRPPDTAEWPMRGSDTRPWWRRVFGGRSCRRATLPGRARPAPTPLTARRSSPRDSPSGPFRRRGGRSRGRPRLIVPDPPFRVVILLIYRRLPTVSVRRPHTLAYP
jgi:hypothetical protein